MNKSKHYSPSPFLSTLSLRRATRGGHISKARSEHFYPRSPCGERRWVEGDNFFYYAFLSTLSLRRATACTMTTTIFIASFLSTLSLRRATFEQFEKRDAAIFLSTLSLRRATLPFAVTELILEFLSTLSLRRATASGTTTATIRNDFYPRSPCGERLQGGKGRHSQWTFLSTLSLRRATGWAGSGCEGHRYFYPRSPCGERHNFATVEAAAAEFLSTLSLRRATPPVRDIIQWEGIFLSTLSLRRATRRSVKLFRQNYISIHALLAESDLWVLTGGLNFDDFYPRSPCGERLGLSYFYIIKITISIHALLAESD